MADRNNQTRIVAIGDPGPMQQQIVTALNAQPEFELVDIISSTERLSREIHAAEPEIILMDQELGGQSTLDIIDEVALQFPEAAVVAILSQEDAHLAQQVTLAGARAFLIQPFTQINLLSTLRRVRDLESRRLKSRTVAAVSATDTSRPLRTITVFSPRGGSGCSTVATNLAIGLYEETGRRVLLLEGKLFFGHLNVMLNLRTQNTIAELIPHAAMLDEGLVMEVVNEHASGIHVLLAPDNIQVAQGIRPDDLYSVFVTLQQLYDFIIVDAGSSLNENTVTLMDSADKILLITTPEMASLHDTSKFVQLSRSLAYSSDKLMVVLNRAELAGGIRSNDIETALPHMVFASIPDDGPNALRSLNRGIPILLRYPRSPASRAIKNLSKSLLTLSATETTQIIQSPAIDKSAREALIASSRLG